MLFNALDIFKVRLQLTSLLLRRIATEGSVLRKMDICIKLIGVFKHESAKHWPVLRDNDVYETMEDEEQQVEESFIKEERSQMALIIYIE